MRNTWAVCKREFKAFFLTPVGYVVVGMVAVMARLVSCSYPMTVVLALPKLRTLPMAHTLSRVSEARVPW